MKRLLLLLALPLVALLACEIDVGDVPPLDVNVGGKVDLPSNFALSILTCNPDPVRTHADASLAKQILDSEGPWVIARCRGGSPEKEEEGVHWFSPPPACGTFIRFQDDRWCIGAVLEEGCR